MPAAWTLVLTAMVMIFVTEILRSPVFTASLVEMCVFRGPNSESDCESHPAVPQMATQWTRCLVLPVGSCVSADEIKALQEQHGYPQQRVMPPEPVLLEHSRGNRFTLSSAPSLKACKARTGTTVLVDKVPPGHCMGQRARGNDFTIRLRPLTPTPADASRPAPSPLPATITGLQAELAAVRSQLAALEVTLKVQAPALGRSRIDGDDFTLTRNFANPPFHVGGPYTELLIQGPHRTARTFATADPITIVASSPESPTWSCMGQLVTPAATVARPVFITGEGGCTPDVVSVQAKYAHSSSKLILRLHQQIQFSHITVQLRAGIQGY